MPDNNSITGPRCQENSFAGRLIFCKVRNFYGNDSFYRVK
nr:MAG TPA: hypothetical protein [Caudoviricetes sp.]